MIIEVMCRIADGPLRPGELEVTQVVAPLVNWSVNTDSWDQQGDVAVELRFPDNTVWTGEAYPIADVNPEGPMPGPLTEDEPPLKVKLRGTGPLKENSIPIHADVVLQRLGAMPSVEK